MTNLMCIRRESCMALGHSIFVPLAEFLSKSCTNLKFLIEPSVCPHNKQSYQGVGRVASIHRVAERDCLETMNRLCFVVPREPARGGEMAQESALRAIE